MRTRRFEIGRFEAGTIVLLVLVALAGGIVYARDTDGVLGGTVLNGKGAPVIAAEVFWQTADGKAPHAARTDTNGRFRIPGVRQGLYDLRAQAAGMTSEWEHNVVVRPGAEANVTLRLSRRVTQPNSGNQHSSAAAGKPSY
jgi:hypothetical protein